MSHSRTRTKDVVTYNGQAHQDRFVLHMMAGKVGSYLEIGASHPSIISNTDALEKSGWTGLSIELDPCNLAVWQATRKQPLVIADATTFSYPERDRIDYLQLDIDPAPNTFKALQKVLETKTRFSIITYETDAYRDDRFVKPSRELLLGLGYTLLCQDVLSIYGPFEDWYVDASIIDVSRLITF